MRRCGLLLLWLLPSVALAGHGMLNAFAGIPWLPAPGAAPGSLWYPLQRLGEETWRATLRSPRQQLRFSLERARVQLATAEAMATQGDVAGLGVALAHWADELGRASAAVEQLPPAARLALLNALLEQQYIGSTDYLGLPLATRRPLRVALEAESQRYAALAAGLSRRERGTLFAREEEVRWSLSMMAAADEQGLED